MSNHDSFLKLIGLENEVAPEESSDDSDSKKEASWTAMIPGAEEQKPALEQEALNEIQAENSQSDGGTPTDWASPEEPEQNDWHEAPLNEAAQEMNRAEQEQVNAEISWGESEQNSQSNSASATELDLEKLTEKTELYAPEDQATDATAVYTAADRSRLGQDGKSTTQTSSKAITLTERPTGTRPTVAFDYQDLEKATDEPSSTEGTAAFDYASGSKKANDGRIVVLGGKVNAQAFHLGNLPLKIGRDPTNDVILDDSNSSRFHGEIREQNGQIFIADLGSTNGIKVNGEIVANKELNVHDVIQIGDCVLEYLSSGVLSKGIPQFAAFAEKSNPGRRLRHLKLKKPLMVAGLAIGGLFIGWKIFISLAGESIVERTKKYASERAETELISVKSAIENQYQKPISEIEPQEAKKAVIAQIKASGFAGAIPPDMMQQLEGLPPEVLQYFVAHPDVLKELVQGDMTAQALNIIIRNRVNAHLQAKEYRDAYEALSLVVKMNPDDKELLSIYDKLRARLESELNAKDSTGYTPSEKKFYEYMERHENTVMKLQEENKLEQAVAYARVVARNIGELMRLDPSFVRVGTEEKARWEEKATAMQNKLEEKEAKKTEESSLVEDGRKVISQIKEALNYGDAAEARRMIEDFLKAYPKHPDLEEVVALQDQLDSGIQKTFDATKSKIATLLEAESFENAWKEYYRIEEIMPNHPKLKDLYASIDTKSESKAVQFYNQARVFEFEADDLVAAEQYYKKAIDTADPHSELSKKASRRYGEVKKRSIQ